MTTITMDEKNRITIPLEIRKKLDLKPGTKIVLSVTRNTILLRKTINPEEFEQIANEIRQELESQSNHAIKFEKLF